MAQAGRSLTQNVELFQSSTGGGGLFCLQQKSQTRDPDLAFNSTHAQGRHSVPNELHR